MSNLNLYLVTEVTAGGRSRRYDTYDAFVVRALSHAGARCIAARAAASANGRSRWAARRIGTAEQGVPGVVLSSFNAG